MIIVAIYEYEENERMIDSTYDDISLLRSVVTADGINTLVGKKI
jgi:hypothetical protein